MKITFLLILIFFTIKGIISLIGIGFVLKLVRKLFIKKYE